MTAQTDIEEKALHWFVVLGDDEAPESAWLEFQDWLEASPAHAAAYDAVERLWVDLNDHAASAPAEAPVIDLAAARARRAKPRSPWLGAAIGIAVAGSVLAAVYHSALAPKLRAFPELQITYSLILINTEFFLEYLY